MTAVHDRPRTQAAPERTPPRLPQDTRTIPGPSWRGLLAGGILLAFLAGGIWSVIDLRINIATMLDSWQNAVNFMGRALPLDFPEAGELVEGTLMTLAIVVVATVLAVLMSIPVALLAARNTSRSAPVRGLARAFVVLMRAMPELILAIIFIRVFGWGMGAVAGSWPWRCTRSACSDACTPTPSRTTTTDPAARWRPPVPPRPSRSSERPCPERCRRSSPMGCTGSTSTCGPP